MFLIWISEEYHVAQVWVIFDLPSQFGPFPHPLAYIHWYRPFSSFDQATGMYQVALSTCQHAPNSEVISIDQIWQACLLTPQFGSASVPASWTSGDTLDLANKCYLDKYLDLHLFEYNEQYD